MVTPKHRINKEKARVWVEIGVGKLSAKMYKADKSLESRKWKGRDILCRPEGCQHCWLSDL